MRHSKHGQRGLILSLLVIAIGIAVTGIAMVTVTQNITTMEEHSRKWPSVTGAVLETSLARDTAPEVRYNYEVNGKTFEGHRIFLTEGPYTEVSLRDEELSITADPPGEETIALIYRPGDSVTVYHNPAIPHEAFLQPYALKNMTGFLIIGTAAVILAILLGLAAFRWEA